MMEIDSDTGNQLERSLRNAEISFYQGEKNIPITDKTIQTQVELRYKDKNESILRFWNTVVWENEEYNPVEIDMKDGTKTAIGFVSSRHLRWILEKAQAVSEFKELPK